VKTRNEYSILVRKPEKYLFVDLHLNGMIILKWILKNRVWTEIFWLRIGSSGGLL
jgi:hypothetical protein